MSHYGRLHLIICLKYKLGRHDGRLTASCSERGERSRGNEEEERMSRQSGTRQIRGKAGAKETWRSRREIKEKEEGKREGGEERRERARERERERERENGEDE